MKKSRKAQKRKRLWKEDDFLLEEEKWKDNFWKVKPFDIHLVLDTDNDGVTDSKDCEWWNPEKQDLPIRPIIERPTIPSESVVSVTPPSLSKPVYVAKFVGINKVVNPLIMPIPPASVPNIPKPQQSVLRTIYPPTRTIDVPQSAQMQMERATMIPSPKDKPTSPEIKKLIEESRNLHTLPVLPNESVDSGTTSFKGQKLFLVSKFGEQFWADERGNIVYRTV